MKAPWFPFYTGDFLASPDVQDMEAHEVGAYVLLLARSWQSDTPGYLEDDDYGMRRAARLSADVWGQCKRALLKKWPLAEDMPGFRYNPRLKKEADKQVELREMKAEAGRKSAERRAAQAAQRQHTGNTNPTPVEIPATGVGENANYSQPQSQPQSQEGKPSSTSSLRSEVDASPEKKIGEVQASEIPDAGLRTPGGAADVGTSIGDGQNGQDGQKLAETDKTEPEPAKLTKQRGGKQLQPEPEHFAAFWQSYTRHDDRAGAVAAFRKLSAADQEAAATRAAAWLAARPDIVSARGDFRPHPATWLNRRRWADASPTAPPTPTVNPQQNAVYPTAIKPGAARHHVPVVTSYGKL